MKAREAAAGLVLFAMVPPMVGAAMPEPAFGPPRNLIRLWLDGATACLVAYALGWAAGQLTPVEEPD